MKIVFFGTSNVALPVLEGLNSSHQVLAVVTSPDGKVGRKQELKESPVSMLATELRLPLLKPEKVKGSPDFFSQLQKLDADIFVVVSYGKILPVEVINIPPLKTVNVHFSLLPKYRGASPIQFALLNGDTQTGTSIFILDEQVDHGPILFQKEVAIDDDDVFLTLAERMAHISAEALPQVLADYQSGKIIPREQNHDLATVTKIITKQDGQVKWNKTAQEIYNQFRAFYPWPGVWTKWQGKTLKITECLPVDSEVEGPPGVVGEDALVVCGKGALALKRVQLEGKTEVSIADFLNGYPNFLSSQLE